MSGVVARRWLRNGALTDAGWLDGEPSERELSAQRACVDSANWTVELAYSQATVDTLRAQLKAAQSGPVGELIEALRARAEAAEAECARAVDALRWYADAENYYAPPGCGNPVRDDMGNRARHAISARTKEQQA